FHRPSCTSKKTVPGRFCARARFPPRILSKRCLEAGFKRQVWLHINASLAAVVAGGGGSAVVVFWCYRLAHRARGRRSARKESGCDRDFRSCRVRRTSFAGVPGAAGSRLGTVS